MKVLALDAYHGGSHAAFLDGWVARSRHTWTVLDLPAHHWKWRMRHSAVTLAEQVAERVAAGESWDAVFCTDMLNLAEWRGLAPPSAATLPAVAYFHENQLTYPDALAGERDLHFAFTNFTTCLAADRVWFNSAFHRDALLGALGEWLKRMPDHQPRDAVDSIRAKASVQYPGVEQCELRGVRRPGPMRVLWAGRWERDKDPQTFFDALGELGRRGAAFRLSVLGQSFEQAPECFAAARQQLADHIDHWGYAPSREAYDAVLREADVVVSTARQEFFGIAIVEAVAAGAMPVVPNRLAYPEVLGDASDCFYDGTATGLASRLAELASRIEAGALWQGDEQRGVRVVSRFAWADRAAGMDDALDELAGA